ncbi:MAG: methyltransferase domain-containing protein [Bacteroidales bacterium]|nr:methyltransferase domain-containing protein [Bacteroidales bacterium]
MNLSPDVKARYTKDDVPAASAQRYAELIAFGPMVFQASRVAVKTGLLDAIRNSDTGLTVEEAAKAAGLPLYGAKVLMEASLSIGTLTVDPDTDRFSLSKTGWFLLNDPMIKVNMDFNHDVNYIGMFRLEESVREGRPAGLEHFGAWPTIYEGLSSLPPQVQKSWFGFDHYYSDNSFGKALEVVFSYHPKKIMDVGGNTGRWAEKCVAHDPEVMVTIVDLPQQIEMMKAATAGKEGAERIDGRGMNLLDDKNEFPSDVHPDIIWMSQFLDCFSEKEIASILSRAAKIMDKGTRLCIMETFWDRQKFEPAAFCLTMTSLYFTALANGNSKMYNSDDMVRIIRDCGIEIEAIHDFLGDGGHSIIVCKKTI